MELEYGFIVCFNYMIIHLLQWFDIAKYLNFLILYNNSIDIFKKSSIVFRLFGCIIHI